MAFSVLEYLFLSFVLEIFTLLYFANEESDDVKGGSTKTAQHSIENYSRNIETMFFKLRTSNEHHLRIRMTPTMLLPWKHSWLQSLSVNQYPHLQPLKVGQRVMLGTHMIPIMS